MAKQQIREGFLYASPSGGLYIPSKTTNGGSPSYQPVDLRSGSLSTGQEMINVTGIGWHSGGGLKHLDQIIFTKEYKGFDSGKKAWVITSPIIDPAPQFIGGKSVYKNNGLFGSTTAAPICFSDRHICVSFSEPEITDYDDGKRRHISSSYTILSLEKIHNIVVKVVK